MEAQYTKHLRGLLLPEEWGKFILHYDLSMSLQDPQLKPNDISNSLTEKKIGFRLDFADLVFIPLRKNLY